MSVRLEFGWIQVGNTVPYSPSQERLRRGLKRTNTGFADLRGRPEAAAGVAEAARSPELRTWHIDLAQPRSTLFSLWCHIGTHVKRTAGAKPRHATGGYVQLLATDYAQWNERGYKALAENAASRVEAEGGVDDWDAAFLLQTVQLNLDRFNDKLVSLSVEFNVWADGPAEAEGSRERLVWATRLGFEDADAASRRRSSIQ